MTMRNFIPQLSRTATFLLAITAPVQASVDDESSGATLPVGVGPGDILNMGTSLVLIIVGIVVIGWLYARARGMHSNNGELIHVLATQALGPKERVLLVEVAGKQLILGTTASQIQTLHVLEQPHVTTSRESPPSGFAERLRTAIKGVRR